MKKKVHRLIKPLVRNYPSIIAVYGRSEDHKIDSRSLERKKKKRFGIFKKSEEWEHEYKY